MNVSELSMDLSGVAACVDAAVAQWGSDSTRLLQVLRQVQERYNHLPADAARGCDAAWPVLLELCGPVR